MADTRYWATLPRDEVAPNLMERIADCRKWLAASGHGAKMLKGWRASIGMNEAGESSAFLSQGGKRGELVKTVVSHVRSLVQGVESLVLDGKPDMQPVAANSDANSREQAILGKGVLEHTHRIHRRDELDRDALRAAMFMTEGFTACEWDAAEGKPVAVDPETGEPALWEGDFVYTSLTPFDVYREPRQKSWRKHLWLIIRKWESRYELAARFPEKASEILNVQGSQRTDGMEYLDLRWGEDALGSDSDLVPVYTFWHKATRACPEGREVVFLSDSLVLKDGPLPYDRLPVEPINPDRIIGTAWAYTNVFDVLGVSDVLNALYSAFATNNTKFGVPSIIGYKGSGLTASTLSSGASYLEVNDPSKKPEVLNFTATAPEAYKLAEVLERTEEMLMGLNQTARGNPPGANMAAQALALLDSKAGAYNAPLMKSFYAYLEGMATLELSILKRYASTERVAVLAGKAKNWMLKSFTSEDLSSIDRIAVEPVKNTASGPGGKYALLEILGNFGVQLTPEQILDFASTGTLEPAFEATETNTLRIKQQVEQLMDGEAPTLLLSDAHWQAIPEFLSVLDNPAAREKPEVVQVVLDTVQQSLELWRSMPPDLLMVRGGPPAPPSMEQMMAGTAPPMPGAPAGTPPPAQGAPSQTPPPMPEDEGPAMPKPPPTLPDGTPYSPAGVPE